jgi:hypothetical protein
MVPAMDRGDLVLLRRARGQMDREYTRPLDVEALARTACMSSGHFSRSFRAAYGETPYGYLMQPQPPVAASKPGSTDEPRLRGAETTNQVPI